MGVRFAPFRSFALAMAALVALVLLPAPVAADTCACDPIQPYLAIDRLGEVHVTYRHSDRPGIIYASNKSGAWVKRRLTDAKDHPFAIGVDSAQKVYIVFEREVGDEVHFHLITNRTGEWVRTRLGVIQDDSYRIRIQLDPERRIHLAWSRDEQVWYATNASGTWERRRLDDHLGNNAQLAVDAQGVVHLAYQQCRDDGTEQCLESGIWYETNASGSWSRERISDDGADTAGDLVADPGGRVHLVFGREDNSQEHPDLPLGTFYVTNAGGTWTTRRVAPEGRWYNIERARGGAITIVYMRVDDDDRRGIYMATNVSGTWVRSTVVREWAMYPSTGITGVAGVVHLAYMRMEGDPGIYYANNRGDGWSRRELMD